MDEGQQVELVAEPHRPSTALPTSSTDSTTIAMIPLLPPDNKSSSEEKESPEEVSPKKSKDRPWASWWWWWEIGSCVTSIVGCGLLLVLLWSIDEQSQASWPYPVAPNTLLAIISTLSRTAMMVPVASCLSQLKWRHFRIRQHRLSHLDVIDRASRGPSGSLLLIFQLGRASVVISMLAAVTVLSLAVGSTVQQLLEMPSRNTTRDNATAEIGIATQYTSRSREWSMSREGPYSLPAFTTQSCCFSSADEICSYSL